MTNNMIDKIHTAEEIYDNYNKKCYNGAANKELFSIKEMIDLIKIAQLNVIENLVEECAEKQAQIENKQTLPENIHRLRYLTKDDFYYFFKIKDDIINKLDLQKDEKE